MPSEGRKLASHHRHTVLLLAPRETLLLSLPFGCVHEPPIIMTGTAPTPTELAALIATLTAWVDALAGGSPSVIADPADFQRSPYAQDAPLNLNSKSGLHLYVEAQELLKIPFNGKAANVQPFLNSLAVDVKKYGLEPAVTVRSATGTDYNLLTQYGSFTEDDATAFFDNGRKEQILGQTATGGAVTLSSYSLIHSVTGSIRSYTVLRVRLPVAPPLHHIPLLC